MPADRAAPVFVDTNVLVYAFASDDPVRSPVARKLIEESMISGTLRTSTQVLQELFVTLTRKGERPLSSEQALRYLESLAAFPVAVIDFAAIRIAAGLSASHRISFWDALIIVAAGRSGAVRLYSEDLQDRWKVIGLEVVNPFHVA